MYWVKLTGYHDGKPVYVNLDRFDMVIITLDDEGREMTRISSCLSSTERDIAIIDVKERPEAFMGPPKMKVPDNGQ